MTQPWAETPQCFPPLDSPGQWRALSSPGPSGERVVHAPCVDLPAMLQVFAQQAGTARRQRGGNDQTVVEAEAQALPHSALEADTLVSGSSTTSRPPRACLAGGDSTTLR